MRKTERRAATQRGQSSLPVVLGSPAQLVREATQHHKRGELSAAEALYRRVLVSHPHHAESLHSLGIVLFQQGRLEEAGALMDRSIRTDGGNAGRRSNFGLVLQALGRLEEASSEYRHALALSPQHAEAWSNLGNILQGQGKLEDAALHYQQALALRPSFADALVNLGAVRKTQGQLGEAVDCYLRAITLQPGNANAHYNLGNALTAQGKVEEAIAHYNTALALKPAHADASFSLGIACVAAGRTEEALTAYRKAIQIDPTHTQAYTNLGAALVGMGSVEEGIVCYRRAPAFATDSPKVRLNLAMAYLVSGDLNSGWPEYEWRHLASPASAARSFPQPQWHGEPLTGRRILIHHEQGLGDTIQMLRYIPLVHHAGGEVLLLLPICLHRLAEGIAGVSAILPLDADPLPAFELHCPMMSLPLAFKTTLSTIPAEVSYLRAPEKEVKYATALPWPEKGLRIGLVWAGNPSHTNDRARSLNILQLRPLLGLDGVHYFSLQAGPAAEQLVHEGEMSRITDLAPSLADMADAAGKIMQMDVMITADTALAHLSGALGVPTWVMIPYAPDWRWLRDRTDSPWYPAARLFRQPRPGDWDAVIETICVALQELKRTTPSR